MGEVDTSRRGEGRDAMVWPSDDADTESAIKVLMDRDRVVVRPIGHLDRDSIETIIGLLGCAREAGLIAVVDLDEIEPGDLAGRDALGRLMTKESASSPSRT
jgi:hypothetical protein